MASRAVSRRAVIGGLGALSTGVAAHALVVPATASAAPRSPQAAMYRLSPAWAAEWIQTCYDLTWREGPSPTQAARCYNYLALAMYEACVAGMPLHRSVGGQLTGLGVLPRARGEIDWVVALAASAHRVAQSVYASGTQANRDTLTALRDRQVAARRAAGVPQGIVAGSAAHGRAIGESLVAWIATDGWAGIQGRDYVPPPGEANWQPTHPNFRPAVEPYWSEIRPMVMRSADEARPADHVPFSAEPGSPFWQEAMTVYTTGGHAGANLTDEQRSIARFWTDNPLLSGLPAGHWMLAVSQVARLKKLSLGDVLEAYARLGVAAHDSFLNCWTWKYRLNLLRPSTYVRRYIDSNWVTFVNSPQFPEYTSGHSVASRAASTVLTDLLGTVAYVDDSHRDRNLPARSFTSFHDAADEAARSRLYGGIHYVMAIENGKEQGDAIGDMVIARLRTRA